MKKKLVFVTICFQLSFNVYSRWIFPFIYIFHCASLYRKKHENKLVFSFTFHIRLLKLK